MRKSFTFAAVAAMIALASLVSCLDSESPEYVELENCLEDSARDSTRDTADTLIIGKPVPVKRKIVCKDSLKQLIVTLTGPYQYRVELNGATIIIFKGDRRFIISSPLRDRNILRIHADDKEILTIRFLRPS